MVRNVLEASQGSGDVMIKSAKVSRFLDSLYGVLPGGYFVILSTNMPKTLCSI